VQIVDEIGAVWNAITKRVSPNDYTAVPKNAVPRDIGLQLDFPESVSDTKHKVLYALWKEGEQCYCNLRLLTGLSEQDIRPAIRGLIDAGQVEKFPAPRSPVFQENDAMNRFRLVHPKET
jgi:hypothetical protein